MLKTILIGAGGIAQHHCKSLKKLGIEILGIYDVNQERAEALAKEWETKALSSYEEMLDKVDMVHILTPPSKRVEYACKAMEKGKHIFMEKPLADSIKDAYIMERCAAEKQICFMTAFTQRFRRGYKMLKELYESKKLGEMVQIFSIRIGPGAGFHGLLQDGWRTDANLVCGMTIESLSHDIDFMRSIAGEVTRVKGETIGTVPSLPMFDNNSNSVFAFENGAIGTIVASWNSHIAFNMRGIIGTEGTAILQGNDIWDFTELRVKLASEEYEETKKIEDIFQAGEAYLEENKYFVECIERKVKPECDVAVGRRVLEISLEILESHKNKRK